MFQVVSKLKLVCVTLTNCMQVRFLSNYNSGTLKAKESKKIVEFCFTRTITEHVVVLLPISGLPRVQAWSRKRLMLLV